MKKFFLNFVMAIGSVFISGTNAFSVHPDFSAVREKCLLSGKNILEANKDVFRSLDGQRISDLEDLSIELGIELGQNGPGDNAASLQARLDQLIDESLYFGSRFLSHSPIPFRMIRAYTDHLLRRAKSLEIELHRTRSEVKQRYGHEKALQLISSEQRNVIENIGKNWGRSHAQELRFLSRDDWKSAKDFDNQLTVAIAKIADGVLSDQRGKEEKKTETGSSEASDLISLAGTLWDYGRVKKDEALREAYSENEDPRIRRYRSKLNFTVKNEYDQDESLKSNQTDQIKYLPNRIKDESKWQKLEWNFRGAEMQFALKIPGRNRLWILEHLAIERGLSADYDYDLDLAISLIIEELVATTEERDLLSYYAAYITDITFVDEYM